MKLKMKIKKGISFILSMVMTASIAGAVFPIAVSADSNAAAPPTVADRTGLSTRLENGDFEIPKLDKTWSPWYMMTYDPNDDHAKVPEGFYWKTTAYDKLVELAGEHPRHPDSKDKREYWPQYHNSTTEAKEPKNPDPDNHNIAELVAEEQSSLYQNLETTPGAMLSWGLSHVARKNESIISKHHYRDTMALFIGPMQKYNLIKENPNKVGHDTKDIFMWMGEFLRWNNVISSDFFADGSQDDEFHRKEEHIIYVSPNAAENILKIVEDKDIGINNPNDYRNYFSLTKTDACPDEWKCWIIGDSAEKWESYGGKYDVPDGQTKTTFAFTALTGTENQNEGGSGFNEGNLLDNIKFAIAWPLRVSSTGGGGGTVSAAMDADGNMIGTDANGKPTNTDNVTDTKTHSKNYMDGTNVTISATADNGYDFLGVFVNGRFVSADRNYTTTDGKKFYDDVKEGEDDKTYKFTVEMNKARYIQLIFVGKGTVMYDPNGGTFNGKSENMYVKFADDGTIDDTYAGDGKANTDVQIAEKYSKWHNPVGKAIPPEPDDEKPGVPKEKFVGWYFARGTQTGISNDPTVNSAAKQGALITPDHTVEYIAENKNKPDADILKLTYKSTSDTTSSGTREYSVKDGITFVAEYDYLQRDVAVLHEGDKYIEYSGGTVTLGVKDADNVTDKNDDRELVSGHTKQDKYSYARLRDNITMNATADTGYTFEGWYEKVPDKNNSSKFTYQLIQRAAELKYGVDTCHTYYALFKKTEEVVEPPKPTTEPVINRTFVSFVSESENIPSSADGTPFKNGTHVKSYENGAERTPYLSDTSRIGGNTVFGNTISTGFTAEAEHDGNSSNNMIKWTITIPVKSGDGTYVKTTHEWNYKGGFFNIKSSGDMDLPAVLEDSDDLINSNYFNRGKIFKVTGVNEESKIPYYYDRGITNAISIDDALWEYYGLGSSITDSDTSSDEVDSFTDDATAGEAAETDGEADTAVTDFVDSEGLSDTFYEDLGEFENPFEAEMNEIKYYEDTANKEIRIKLMRSLGTTITGSCDLIYGLVIDNIYAPGATATATVGSNSSTEFQDMNGGEVVDATSASGYRTSDNNEYYKYEKDLKTPNPSE